MSKLSKLDDLDTPLFGGDEDMPSERLSGDRTWKVLVVDDDEDMVAVTRLVLSSFMFENVPIEILSAYSYKQAVAVLNKHQDIAMAFVDVVMETDRAGLDLVRYIRETLNNSEMQLVLRTGQPGYAPEMDVILEYGINDYRIKTDLDNVKLTTTLVSALRNYKNIIVAKQAARNEAIMDEINKSKSLFFAQMSHDLRTPLNSILGFCELLNLTPLSVEQTEHVQLIQYSGNHLLSIVNDILDFSKGEAGKIQLHLVPFSLRELVSSSCQILQPQVAEGVEFLVNGLEDLPPILFGDPLRIRQILQNLMGNALKFTQQGKVELWVRAQLVQQEWLVEFVVADTGVGISQSRIEQLFGAYEQEETTGHHYIGTGLGLAICRQLVRLMKGTIAVKSELNKGSRFKVSIVLPPLPVELNAMEQPLAANGALNDIVGGHQLWHCKALVVDDETTNRLVAQKMLQTLGFQVECVSSGMEALAAVAKTQFDIVFMDFNMPEMDGAEATRRIRQLETYVSIPIIALTGTDLSTENTVLEGAGFTDYLQKPVHMETLKKVISTVTRRSN